MTREALGRVNNLRQIFIIIHKTGGNAGYVRGPRNIGRQKRVLIMQMHSDVSDIKIWFSFGKLKL